MRHPQSTLSSATVQAQARRLLREHLELQDYKRSVPAELLVSVLLLAACWQLSLSCVCSFVHQGPSFETVRKALFASLPPKPTTLRRRLLAALHQSLPEHMWAASHAMALDLHQRPYWGRPTRGTTLREKKKSTKKSFTYATLAVLGPTGRFTAGLLLTRPHMRLTTIVATLLDQVAEADLSVAYLLMDKEFYAAEVIDLLQRRGIAFIMPAQQRGKKADGGNRHLFAAGTAVGWYKYGWKTPLRRRDFHTGKRHKRGTLTVEVSMCVARQARTGKPLVYACWGLSGWSPAGVVRAYRKRFGIESGYRQLGQCLAPTSSRREDVRLLLVGVALLLLNVWAWTHSEVLGEGPLGERRLRLETLRLAALRFGVAFLIALEQGLIFDYTTQGPIPQEVANAGTG
jgi:Transposase DDE domain